MKHQLKLKKMSNVKTPISKKEFRILAHREYSKAHTMYREMGLLKTVDTEKLLEDSKNYILEDYSIIK